MELSWPADVQWPGYWPLYSVHPFLSDTEIFVDSVTPPTPHWFARSQILWNHLGTYCQISPHLCGGQLNCWSLRCSWSITCRCCSDYIFILDLTHGFNRWGKDKCKTRLKTFKFWDLVRLILENWLEVSDRLHSPTKGIVGGLVKLVYLFVFKVWFVFYCAVIMVAISCWSWPGIVLYMRTANERRLYNVTSFPIGRVHTQNDPWLIML